MNEVMNLKKSKRVGVYGRTQSEKKKERGKDVIILQSQKIRRLVKLLFCCIPMDIPENVVLYTLVDIIPKGI